MSDERIKAVLDKYELDYRTSTWPVPGGKSRAIFHKDIELIAAKERVKFEEPRIIDDDPKHVVIVVTGHLPTGQTEWSFGEASEKNCKNMYPWAMAEKRAKDRVTLKLVGLHGLLYSEDEADEFKKARPSSPPEVPEVQKPAEGPPREVPARTEQDWDFIETALKKAVDMAASRPELKQWGIDHEDEIDGLPEQRKNRFDQHFIRKWNSLKKAVERVS